MGFLAMLGLAVLLSVPANGAAPAPAKGLPIAKIKRSGSVDFEREILPILKNNCLSCHNETKPKGGLILETPRTILKGGDAGPAVVPKKPAESLLLKAAAHQDPELIMPPPDNKVAAMPLKPEELGLLQLWIEQGAKGEVRASAPIVWQAIPSALTAIYATALTRDGQFAACGRGNQVFVYHVPTGRLAARLSDPQLQKTSSAGAAHRDTINSLAFSPDGELLASGGYRDVKLWRRVKPDEKSKWPGGLETLATSPDGKQIVAASTNGEVRVVDQNGKTVRTLTPAGARVTALKFLSGTNLVMARGKNIKLVALTTGATVARGELPAEVKSISPTGRAELVVACGDDVIRVMGLATNGATLAVVKELKSPASVQWVEAGAALTNQFLAGGADDVVRLWDLGSGKAVAEYKHGAALTALVLRPDGKYFATAGGAGAKLWKAGESNAVVELKGEARALFTVGERERELTFAKSEIDYRKTALKTAETNQVGVAARQKKAADTNAALAKIAGEKQAAVTNALTARRDAETAIAELAPEVRGLVEGFFAAEKASTNAAALAKAAIDGADKTKAEKLSAEANTKSNLLVEAKAALDKLPAETKATQKIATDKLVAANKAVTEAEKEFKKAEQARSTADHELELATGALKKAEAAVTTAKEVLAQIEAEAAAADKALAAAQQAWTESARPITAVAFSPDNLALITADDRGSVRTWSAESGRALESLGSGRGPIQSLVPLGPARVLAMSPASSAVWDFTSSWVLERVIGSGDANSPLADRVNALRFTADGQQLFTGGGEPTRGGEIKLWRVKDGVFVRDFPNVHSDSVFALDVSANGKFLASGAADRFAKSLDVATGKIVKTFEGHTHHVLGVAWKRDARTLLTAGADNVAKVWDATTGERRKNIEGFGKEITAAAFVGVSDEAVLGAGDGQVVLVKSGGEKVRSFAGASDYVNAVAVTPDGATVVAGGADGVLRAWDGKSGKLLSEFQQR